MRTQPGLSGVRKAEGLQSLRTRNGRAARELERNNLLPTVR